MATWHRRARRGVAVFGLAVAAVVYLAMGERQVSEPRAPVARIDENAIAEIRGGTLERTIPLGIDRQLKIDAEFTQQYPDGSTKWTNPRITVRRGDKDFVASGGEARAGPESKDLEIKGEVKMQASDGFQLATEHATYNQDEGIARAAGAVTFAKGRMTGSGVGFSYDEAAEVLIIGEQASIETRDEEGNTLTALRSSFLTLDRLQDLLLLSDGVHVTREGQVIEARDAVAQLSPAEDVITFLTLTGGSRVTGAGSSIDAMSARDIDLDYTDDGSVLEKVLMRGDGAIALTAQLGAGGRQIHGQTLDLTLAADGSLLHVIGKDRVELALPAAPNLPARNIRAATLDARGEGERGLTDATFTGEVEYREQGGRGAGGLSARGQALQISLANDAVTSATFTGRALFEDQGLTAGAARIAYQPEKRILELSGTAGGAGACVADSLVNVDAQTILVTLQGHRFNASGAVKTVLRGQSTAKPAALCGGRPVTAAAPRTGEQGASRLPGLLDPKTSAQVTSDTLEYLGAGGSVVFTGTTTSAAVIQGTTSIRASRIEIDQAKGDLVATGSAIAGIDLDGVSSIGSGDEIRYADAKRLVTFSTVAGGLQLAALQGGAQGDLFGGRIDVVLAKGESKVERIDATRAVSVTLETRKVTGAHRLTYHGGEDRYDLEGNPLTWLDKDGKECREYVGTTLTFDRSGKQGAVLDGKEERRFQTTPRVCPATFR